MNKLKITYKVDPDYTEGQIYINGKFVLDIAENEVINLQKMYNFEHLGKDVYEYDGFVDISLSEEVGHLWFNNLYYIPLSSAETEKIKGIINN